MRLYDKRNIKSLPKFAQTANVSVRSVETHCNWGRIPLNTKSLKIYKSPSFMNTETY